LVQRSADRQSGTPGNVERREGTRTARQPERGLGTGGEAVLERVVGQQPEEVAVQTMQLGAPGARRSSVAQEGVQLAHVEMLGAQRAIEHPGEACAQAPQAEVAVGVVVVREGG
jgi:hypothetical protein